MAPDGNAISGFSNNVSHQLYARSSGLSHRATIIVAVLCSVFAFLLFMFVLLCCCFRRRRKAFTRLELQGLDGQSFNPSQLWNPSQAERDLEFAASQDRQGWTLERDIPRSEQNLTTTELVPDTPCRVVEASPSSAVLPVPRFPLPASIREPPEMSIPHEETPTSISATSTPIPAFTCCNNTFRTRAEYNRHRRYHDKPETCPHCQRSFGTTRDVERHVNQVHQRTKVWFCLEASCKHSRASGGKGFPRKDNWRRHMRDAHGVEAN